MRESGQRRGLPRTYTWTWMIAALGACGCSAPGIRDCVDISTPVVYSADSTPIAQAGAPLPNAALVHASRGPDTSTTVEGSSLVETWGVHTRACEQKMGSDPWPSMTIARLDAIGEPLRGSDPETLLARMAGRTSVFLIHGYGYVHRVAVEEAVKVRAQLEAIGGLPRETLFIVFDWPSEREFNVMYMDLNEKVKRSRVASYHLARFLQESPAGSRVCLMGQSDGGRIALSTMHLLSGAMLRAFLTEPEAQLRSGRPAPR